MYVIGHGKRACGVYDCKEDGERGNGVCAHICVSAGKQKKRVQVFPSERGSVHNACKHRKVGEDL